MSPPRNAAWAELVQLVPVITLAFPFIVDGRVELSRAGSGFLVAALLSILVSAVVIARRQLLNPILVGTALWLWLGAIAFNVPVVPLADWLAQTQAFGLFAAAFMVGLIATLVSPRGYIACPCGDPRWIRQASVWMLGLSLLTVGWAWLFRNDIRLGGGLPFIVLNVSRRMIGRRAPLPR